MKTRLVVSAVIRKDNKYLFGRKLKDVGPYPNTWVIIGGGVDLEKETLEDAIRREVREEAHIEIKNLKRVIFDEDYEQDKNRELTHYAFLIFTSDYSSGNPKPGDDIARLQWFSKKEIKNIKLSRPTIKLLDICGLR